MELAIRRFDFDGLQDFDAPPPPINVANDHTLPEAEEFAPPPPPSFSEEELNAAKSAAYESGRQAGVEEEAARQQSEQRARDDAAAQAMQQLAGRMTGLQSEFAAFKAAQTEELGALVKLLVRKVAGDALDAAPEAAIEGLIEECLGVLQSEPKIIMHVHPDVFETIEGKLRSLAEQHHLENSITLKTNAQLALSEARMDWQSGAAERDMDTIWQQIDRMIGEMNFAQLAEIQTPNTIETNNESSTQGESHE